MPRSFILFQSAETLDSQLIDCFSPSLSISFRDAGPTWEAVMHSPRPQRGSPAVADQRGATTYS
jgi:hypothetical protein